jgi:hypothetical protein
MKDVSLLYAFLIYFAKILISGNAFVFQPLTFSFCQVITVSPPTTTPRFFGFLVFPEFTGVSFFHLLTEGQ